MSVDRPTFHEAWYRVVNLRPLDVTHTVMYEHVDLLDAFVSENPDSLLLYQIKEKMTCLANAN